MKTLITDPRLGRLPEFDPQNLLHPIRAVLPIEAKKPRSYSWSVPVQLDQGNVGACVGFSFAHELAARPAKMPWLKNVDGLTIYKKAQTLDQWPGDNYEGSSVLGGVKAVMELFPKAYESYKWAFGIDDVILTLGYFGPVVLGINWYSDMFNPDSSGIIKVGGYVAGGHAILANAVNVKKKLIHLKNSWGASWGKGGGCYISFDDLDRLLKEGGEACIPVQRKVVKPLA